jgi:LexA-binding, inner membrane-associated putative hydrolase
VFIGHYAVALAAKRAAPRTSLGTLFAAVSLADLLWPVFLLLGWERAHVVPGPNPFLTLSLDSIPISHSLITLIGWGALFAFLYRLRAGDGRAALVVTLLVVSHWVLDYVTHRPDMPLYPGGTPLGLGLWNSVAGTIAVEGVMFLAGLWIYVGATRARDRIGRYGFWSLIALLVLSYLLSLFSPAPSSRVALAIFGIIFGWLFVGWAGWGDKHRETVVGRYDATL